MHHPPPPRRWRSALATLATALTATVVTAAGNAAGATPWSVSAGTDPAAPGMIRVAWPASAEESNGAYRVRWWAGSTTAGAPLGSVVLDNPTGRTTPPHAVAIPSLTDGQTYTVAVDVVTTSGGPLQVLTSPATASTTAHGVTGTCPMSLTVCGALPADPDAAPRVTIFSGSTSGGAMIGMGGFGWSPGAGWPHADNAGTSAWIDARISITDPHGALTSHWWSMVGDSGASFESATDLLLPVGGSVNVGQLTDPAGTTIGGTVRKLTPAGAVADLADADFADLCVYVMRDTGAEELEFTTLLCGFGQGFGTDPAVPGAWRLAVPTGTYRVRFVDRPNYFGAQNVLLYNVNSAAQWWRVDGSRGETERDTTAQPFAGASPIVVGSSPITSVDAILRPAKQLELTVTDIPAEHADGHLHGDIRVTDEFGNWTGGAMTIDTATRTASASVTGLVEGRGYHIFLSFTADDSPFTRWWLVGGGTVDDAAWRVPGTTVVEPWQPAPIVVTLHHPDGTAYGAGEACLYVQDVADTAPGHLGAASCTDGSGIVRLQQLRTGHYRVVADGTGGPVRIADLHVPDDVPQPSPVVAGYVFGYHDLSRLLTGASIPPPYVADAAIVVP